MAMDLITGKLKGKMKGSEVVEFIRRDEEGEVEPPEWSAYVTAKLAFGMVGAKGQWEVERYYDLDEDYLV